MNESSYYYNVNGLFRREVDLTNILLRGGADFLYTYSTAVVWYTYVYQIEVGAHRFVQLKVYLKIHKVMEQKGQKSQQIDIFRFH